ncbi:MAG: molybdopterin-guanine dinucleotide biosynthesis protein MobB [Candidatus Sedimenticola endophacoides]|uniref:Molybdopterin-guanine dinucleotide biosynthesis protein B n=1 Tax=Candidatus Sedimenticola endophacoides TaxID=2548426 RepID=A0A657Q393_9GAMM|nr:MAG: molybdopterin-guanine dinucleotide biosynthesis protein B [Candidatus Sedimenticola endophacoides]OQX33855.1 MAG: molybdopterin-guanine dinucleotide biosynthesis protein B [Candidatus Sedimenticola endophacoides]OQX39780.1 MAG: molybdopterin-guanine dinucleotide biosynthesis protein B [Candidatus Sedimenticola endophacoides]OQX47204.1 MAG: molybdopterin-guanine dinucleotide biosynthesis protein B [Candidatus Sedimenticola endophacoides]OQX48305.1 MAG: molybdopterin-guanine dinucleotide 
MVTASIPVLGFAAYSGTGKTTLLKRLLPLLRARGLRVGMIKHAHHDFDIDTPGKDSYELRKAGAAEMLIASGRRWALMVETPREGDPLLQEMLDRLDQRHLDLVLVEGFKHEPFPKIELHRPALGKPLLFPEDREVIAVASDSDPGRPVGLPLLDLNDVPAMAEFIWRDFLGREALAQS